jgi:hypothetical protein
MIDLYPVDLPMLEDYPKVARSVALWAVNDTLGRSHVEDPVYEHITNHKLSIKQGWYFSSCAFLPLYVYEALGINLSWVYRDKPGEEPSNPLSRLAFAPESISYTPDYKLQTGDTLQTGSNGDSHVSLILSAETEVINSADYGQPGGKLRTRYIRESKGRMYVENIRTGRRKPARRVLPLLAAVESASIQALLGSALLPRDIASAYDIKLLEK